MKTVRFRDSALTLQLRQSFLDRIWIKGREVQVAPNEDDDPAALVEIDRRRDVDGIAKRFLRDIGQGL
ncbi:hypothetical protein chiPu_0033421 [Chiloscyllium punctatum]|uniref:Uncharacterized protein n=1 Tax=Chiloscyllium punctatum TaxID=137246 RepID=A0A401U3E9_CHIPU|nr:hypothetical protein [Chiloscyllium punctatum]